MLNYNLQTRKKYFVQNNFMEAYLFTINIGNLDSLFISSVLCLQTTLMITDFDILITIYIQERNILDKMI